MASGPTSSSSALTSCLKPIEEAVEDSDEEMAMAEYYCDYRNKRLPDYWLVVPDGASMPAGLREEDWELVRKRPSHGLSDGGRQQVDDEGYAILRFNVSLDELQAL